MMGSSTFLYTKFVYYNTQSWFSRQTYRPNGAFTTHADCGFHRDCGKVKTQDPMA